MKDKPHLKDAQEILAKLIGLRNEIAAKSLAFKLHAISGVNDAIAYLERFIAANS